MDTEFEASVQLEGARSSQLCERTEISRSKDEALQN